MSHLARFLLALLALVACAPALAQSRPPRGCTDDNGVDRCAAEQQQRMRELYGARPIEAHLAAGEQVVRVFYVDGYGRDMVAIELIRAPGRDPRLVVRYRRPEGGTPTAIEAPVAIDIWNDMLVRASQFDRSFAPGPPGNSDEIIMCLHGWHYLIEASEPGARPPRIRRKSESACEDGPGELFAYGLQRTALDLFPHCAMLDAEQHRNPASQLNACGLLSGDRMVAAQILNRLRPLLRAGSPQDEALLRGLFEYEMRIDWNGESNSGPGSAAAFWAGKLAQPSGRANFYVQSVEGLSAGRVRVRGELGRSASDNRSETAAVELIWTNPNGGPHQISEARVGPWRPIVAPTR